MLPYCILKEPFLFSISILCLASHDGRHKLQYLLRLGKKCKVLKRKGLRFISGSLPWLTTTLLFVTMIVVDIQWIWPGMSSQHKDLSETMKKIIIQDYFNYSLLSPAYLPSFRAGIETIMQSVSRLPKRQLASRSNLNLLNPTQVEGWLQHSYLLLDIELTPLPLPLLVYIFSHQLVNYCCSHPVFAGTFCVLPSVLVIFQLKCKFYHIVCP